MQELLLPGKEVWLKLPYGDFSVQSVISSNQDVVLVAGGTGVSPFIPFVKKEMDAFSEQKIKLIYGVRRPEHLLFKDIYEKAIQNSLKFSMDLFCEQAGAGSFVNGANQIEGIISLDHLYNIYKEYTNPVFFLSGPPKMIKYFKSGLIEKGINSECVKIDEWE
jgi:ferredoxin-NADP reductase